MVRTKKSKSSRLPAGDTLTKCLSYPNVSVSTNAAGFVPVTTLNCTLVENAPATEWASFAARYQQYRVKSFTVFYTPAYPADFPAPGLHLQLYWADFIGASAPTSVAQVLADERSVIHGTFQSIVFKTTWDKNPNAKLWNPTTAIVPIANSFGVSFCSSVAAATVVSAFVGSLAYEWEVEFRGAQ